MELSRRDAMAALAAAGVAAGGAVTLDQLQGEAPRDESDVETLVAVAEIVYPDAVEGIPAFVETYSVGRVEAREAYAEGVSGAVADLDDAARSWYDAPFRTLDADTRDDLLRELGCDTAEPDPDGTTAERLRYYLLNELLFALYTSPTGGELVGIQNPQGHAGGTTSYRRGPER
jgi:hypothetical protein